MPRLNELQTSYAQDHVSLSHALELAVEETLVPDRRLRQSTSQMLEDKLRRLTRSRQSMAVDHQRRLVSVRP